MFVAVERLLGCDIGDDQAFFQIAGVVYFMMLLSHIHGPGLNSCFIPFALIYDDYGSDTVTGLLRPPTSI